MARIALKVQKLREAMEHLKRPEVELGAEDYRNRDKSPRCALGHLAAFADPEGFAKGRSCRLILKQHYGFDGYAMDEVSRTNDLTSPPRRKAFVIAQIEHLITDLALETAPSPASQE